MTGLFLGEIGKAEMALSKVMKEIRRGEKAYGKQ